MLNLKIKSVPQANDSVNQLQDDSSLRFVCTTLARYEDKEARDSRTCHDLVCWHTKRQQLHKDGSSSHRSLGAQTRGHECRERRRRECVPVAKTELRSRKRATNARQELQSNRPGRGRPRHKTSGRGAAPHPLSAHPWSAQHPSPPCPGGIKRRHTGRRRQQREELAATARARAPTSPRSGRAGEKGPATAFLGGLDGDSLPPRATARREKGGGRGEALLSATVSYRALFGYKG
jgi:hypothetical protein